jgi:hypothetical protein
LVAHFELLKLAVDVPFELLNGFGDAAHHFRQLVGEPFDLGVDHVVVHFPSGLPVDEVVMDVGLLRQPLHREGHLLVVEQLCDVGDVGGQVVAAVLLFEEAGRAGESFGALGMRAEILDGFGGMLGTTNLVVQLVGLLLLHGLLALHQLSSRVIIISQRPHSPLPSREMRFGNDCY